MVKATFKGKREPMELEGDMILGATIQEDAIGKKDGRRKNNNCKSAAIVLLFY